MVGTTCIVVMSCVMKIVETVVTAGKVTVDTVVVPGRVSVLTTVEPGRVIVFKNVVVTVLAGN